MTEKIIDSPAFEEMTNAERQYIIKDGLLIRGLGGKESQIRSKVPGVANFRACSWNRAPIDRMANLNLEPGDFVVNPQCKDWGIGQIQST